MLSLIRRFFYFLLRKFAPTHGTMGQCVARVAAAGFVLLWLFCGAEFVHKATEQGFGGSDYNLAPFYFFLAIIYFLGFFYYLPDLLGGRVRVPGTLQERWSAWLQWSGLLAMAWAVLAVGLVVKDILSIPGQAKTLPIMVLLSYCAGAVAVALQRYSSVLPENPSSFSSCGPRVPFGTFIRRLGAPSRWLVSALRPRRAVFSGSILLLATLVLVTTTNFSCSNTEYRGYQILTGEASWITAENFDKELLVHSMIRYVGWILYALALCVAIIGFGFLASRKDSWLLQPKHIDLMTRCSAIVAIFTVSDLAFYFFEGSKGMVLVIWCAYYLFPGLLGIYVYSRRRGGVPADSQALLVPILGILFLPIMFYSFGVLTLIASDVPGFVAFYLGILMLWSGYSQWPRTMEYALSRSTVKKVSYTQLTEFRYYDLAEGYLLEVREGNPMEFIVDAALTRDYPKKEPFMRWRKIAISFPNVRDVRWIRKTMGHPTIDAAGEMDFGGIYEFEIQGYRHRLSGDFGEVEIISDPVQVKDIAHETTDMAGAVPDEEEEHRS